MEAWAAPTSRRCGGTVDREAFTAMFQAHWAAVLAYGLRRVDAETAREVAAETFTVAWRRSADVPAHQLPWLLATARRVLANEVRRRGRADRLVLRLRDDAGGGVAGPVTDHADGVVESDVLQAALARLADRDREVLLLVAWDGMDHEGLAAVLGCSVGAARVRLHRARRRLAAALDAPSPDRAVTTDRGRR